MSKDIDNIDLKINQMTEEILDDHTVNDIVYDEDGVTPLANQIIVTDDDGGGGGGAILYNTTGQNTDGAMTQKATTDELNLRAKYTEISNPNLLINGDFKVNQRGQSTYTTGGTVIYCVDRWRLGSNLSAQTNTNGGITITASSSSSPIAQRIEGEFGLFAGKTLTISTKINGVVYSVSGTIPTQEPTVITNIIEKSTNYGTLLFMYFPQTSYKFAIQFVVDAMTTVTLDYLKLEIGSVATPFIPRPYAEELALCQRYFVALRPVNASYTGICFARSFTNQYVGLINLSTPLRTSPTISYGGGVLRFYREDGSSFATDTSGFSFTVDGITNNILECTIKYTSLSVTSGKFGMLRFDNINAYVFIDAEIY